MKGGNGLDELSFFLSAVYRMNGEKENNHALGWRTYGKSCLLCYVPHTLSFPVCCVSRGGKDGAAASDVVGCKCGGCCLAQSTVSFDQEVSQWPPSGLTVCLQAVELAAAAPSQHLHRSVSTETTRRESVSLKLSCFFVYFNLFCILQKRNQILNRFLLLLLGYVSHHHPLMLSDSMHCCAVYTL